MAGAGGGGATAGNGGGSPQRNGPSERASWIRDAEASLRNGPVIVRRKGSGDNVVERVAGAMTDAIRSAESEDPNESVTGGLASASLEAMIAFTKLSSQVGTAMGRRAACSREGIILTDMSERDRIRMVEELRRQRAENLSRQAGQRSPVQDRLNRAQMQMRRAEAVGRPQRPAPGQARYRAAGMRIAAVAGPAAAAGRGVAGAGAGIARGARMVHPIGVLATVNDASRKAIDFGKLAARKAPGMALSVAGGLMQLTRAARTSPGGSGPSPFPAAQTRSVNISVMASPPGPSMSPQRASQMGVGQSRGMEF